MINADKRVIIELFLFRRTKNRKKHKVPDFRYNEDQQMKIMWQDLWIVL